MNKQIKSIFEFIKNNRLFSVVIAILFCLFIAIIFSPVSKKAQKPTEQVNYYFTTKDFTVINENGELTVQTFDPNFQDPYLIKKSLGINLEQEINVEIPGPLLFGNFEPSEATPIPTQPWE